MKEGKASTGLPKRIRSIVPQEVDEEKRSAAIAKTIQQTTDGAADGHSSIFLESLRNHQKLVDILVEARDGEGISLISQPEMAMRMDHSQAWITAAIKRINTEGTCIECIGSGKYLVRYEDLSRQGVFSRIMAMIEDSRQDPSLFTRSYADLAAHYAVSEKTAQMFKAYLRTGWTQK